MGEIEMPKALVPIGGKPIVWHVMKMYSNHGFNDFILCLGHKGEMVKEYFEMNKESSWNIECVDTGLDTNKSERIKMVKDLIDGDTFMVSYGDDVSDVDIKKNLEFHNSHRNIATITAIKPISQFGIFETDGSSKITKFKEKPRLENYINGGFMIFNKKIFDHLGEGELEKEVFEKLVDLGEIHAIEHTGFWRCMNTAKDTIELGELWRSGKAEWKTWSD
jgi:glucose-1-phosphate cytidylyltransferase